jgi:ketosteroid isomerase-like protein
VSQENVEIVERIYAAPRTPLAFEVYSTDIEWDMRNVGWMEKAVYHGHDGVREMMRSWIGSFDRWEPTLERVVARDEEVIAVVRDRAYMAGSSQPIVRRYVHTFTFRAGVIVRSRLYTDVSGTLKAVGLEE